MGITTDSATRKSQNATIIPRAIAEKPIACPIILGATNFIISEKTTVPRKPPRSVLPHEGFMCGLRSIEGARLRRP
ncbi:MAG: hypothetical protein WB493_18600 [Anaeromyxobacteraceae bacterium]